PRRLRARLQLRAGRAHGAGAGAHGDARHPQRDAGRWRRSPARARGSADRAMTDQATRRETWPGAPFPLGATWDGEGTNFSLFSEHAEQVELCLFDEEGNEERLDVVERTAHNWHCYVPGVAPGQRYGYRVDGRYAPEEGHRYNPAKLLIDPYAKAIEGDVDWNA